MNAVLAILIALVALAILGFAVYALRSAGQTVSDEADAGAAPARPMPQVQDFHVRGDSASVVFAVPLGDSEAGEHLTELLCASAVEHVRGKVSEGFPLEGVEHIAVYATRNGEPVLLDTVDLPAVGELPDEAPILSRDPSIHDPIEAVAAVKSDSTVRPPSDSGDHLEPVAQLVELSGPEDAHLRAIGVDPATMSLEDLVVGLFATGGYQVETAQTGSTGAVAGDATATYWVRRGGDITLVVIIEHERESYPELDEGVLSRFAVGVAQANAGRAMLVTDKFGPYAMYERERRDKKTVYVTRERLQGFVDSFDLS